MSTRPEPADMAQDVESGSQVLACGAQVDDLLEQVADGNGDQLTAHQDDWVHCQAALTELSQLWALMFELADGPVTAPSTSVQRSKNR